MSISSKQDRVLKSKRLVSQYTIARVSSRVLIPAVAAAMVVATGWVGCASANRVGGSRLSDAIDAVERAEARKKKDDKDERKKEKREDRPVVLRAGHRVPEPVRVVVGAAYEHDHRDHPRRRPRRRNRSDRGEDGRFFLGVSLGRTSFDDEEALRGAKSFAVHAGAVLPENRERLLVEAELGVGPLDLAHDLGGLDEVWELSLGGGVRYFLTPGGNRAGVYTLAGFRAGVVSWDYREPFLLEEFGYEREVRSDHVYSYTPYVGVGVAFVRQRNFQVGMNVTGGFKFFDDYTDEGLRNDVFDTAPLAQIRFDVTHVFK